MLGEFEKRKINNLELPSGIYVCRGASRDELYTIGILLDDKGKEWKWYCEIYPEIGGNSRDGMHEWFTEHIGRRIVYDSMMYGLIWEQPEMEIQLDEVWLELPSSLQDTTTPHVRSMIDRHIELEHNIHMMEFEHRQKMRPLESEREALDTEIEKVAHRERILLSSENKVVR